LFVIFHIDANSCLFCAKLLIYHKQGGARIILFEVFIEAATYGIIIKVKSMLLWAGLFCFSDLTIPQNGHTFYFF